MAPNTDLEFEVELVDFDNSTDFEGDGTLVKTVLVSGSQGWELPSYESKCFGMDTCITAISKL